MISNKKGIISEQLYILFGILVVVVFTINAYKFVNGVASRTGVQQEFAVRDLAMTATTISGAPGIVAYAFYVQKSRQEAFPGQLMLAFYDTRSETYLRYAEYFFAFSGGQEFRKDKNLTDSMHLIRNKGEFGFYNLYSEPIGQTELDCRNYMKTQTLEEIGRKKIVISAASGKPHIIQAAKNLHTAMGGGLATGQNIVLDLEGEEREGDIFLVLREADRPGIILGSGSRQAKKLGCMIMQASDIEEIEQDYDPDLIRNPSPIRMVIELAEGRDYSSEISGSILRYYHE